IIAVSGRVLATTPRRGAVATDRPTSTRDTEKELQRSAVRRMPYRMTAEGPFAQGWRWSGGPVAARPLQVRLLSERVEGLLRLDRADPALARRPRGPGATIGRSGRRRRRRAPRGTQLDVDGGAIAAQHQP